MQLFEPTNKKYKPAFFQFQFKTFDLLNEKISKESIFPNVLYYS